MPKFIRVRTKFDNQVNGFAYIRIDTITSFATDTAGHTFVNTNNGTLYFILDTPDEIMEMMSNPWQNYPEIEEK